MFLYVDTINIIVIVHGRQYQMCNLWTLYRWTERTNELLVRALTLTLILTPMRLVPSLYSRVPHLTHLNISSCKNPYKLIYCLYLTMNVTTTQATTTVAATTTTVAGAAATTTAAATLTTQQLIQLLLAILQRG